MRNIIVKGLLSSLILPLLGFLVVLGVEVSGLRPASVAYAGTASKEFIDYLHPDGSTIRIRAIGNEFCQKFENEDGRLIVLDENGFWVVSKDQSRTCPQPDIPQVEGLVDEVTHSSAPPWAGGVVNHLIIMVQFPADPADPDGAQPAVPCAFTAAEMEANLFGGAATGPGDLHDYYLEVSFGALELVSGPAGVVGCFTVANDKDDYDDGPLSRADLVAEAITLADATVDFAPYDNDSDGVVDSVGVVYAGGGPDNGCYVGTDSTTNSLWPFASSIAAVAVDGGTRSVSSYYIAPELLCGTTIRTIGVYAHEFGHKLGLPDLYDTDNSSDGIGHWGLMGSGSWTSNNPGSENGEAPSHMNPWSKWFLGWIAPTDLTGMDVVQNIPEAETNPFAIQLLDNPGGPDDWSRVGTGNGEYFLIENRQQTGFDIGLDGCGILAWHIEESQSNNANEGHTAASHRLIDPEEADGIDPMPNRGDAGDPFPGTSDNRVFADATTPSARLYDGSNTAIQMEVVSDNCAANMLANFGNPEADLAISKSDDLDPVAASGTLVYSITVINDGPSKASEVEVIDTLPAEVTYVSDSGGCTHSAGTVTCVIDELMPSESQDIEIVVQVDAGLVDDTGSATITNQASVSSLAPPDPDLGNNSVTEDTEVLPGCSGLIATISGTPSGEPILGTPGDDVIAALAGNDNIIGLGGSDSICSGTGSDNVVAGGGNNQIDGGPGNDQIIGGAGNDQIDGGPGNDRIVGGAGTDTCVNGELVIGCE